MRYLINIWTIAKRELKILRKNPLYFFCMVVCPWVWSISTILPPPVR